MKQDTASAAPAESLLAVRLAQVEIGNALPHQVKIILTDHLRSFLVVRSALRRLAWRVGRRVYALAWGEQIAADIESDGESLVPASRRKQGRLSIELFEPVPSTRERLLKPTIKAPARSIRWRCRIKWAPSEWPL